MELCRVSRTPVREEQKDQISGSKRSPSVNLCFLACVAVGLRNKRTRYKCNHRHCVRAAKEMDLKSIGLCPQGFESPRCRFSTHSWAESATGARRRRAPLKAPGGRKRRVPSAAPYWNAVWRAAGNQDRASKRRAGRARAAALISLESRVELLLKTVCPSG